MWNLNVKVIKVGTCTIDSGNMASPAQAKLKHQLGINGGSTVTVIREGSEVLLVDTGFEREQDLSPKNRERNLQILKTHLRWAGLETKDITKVFITHFHQDHIGGIEYFDQATWYGYRPALAKLKDHYLDNFTPLDDGDFILPQTQILPTPGHTQTHCSIIWSNPRKTIRVIICGDAIINFAALQAGSIWKLNSDFYNVGVAKESIRNVLKKADILIPGHGQPFFKPVGLKI